MNYVTCINNQTLALDEPADTYGAELVVGQVYKVVPSDPNDPPHSLRTIDGSGEDYLYPAIYFTPLTPVGNAIDDAVTVHLPTYIKGILHAEAIVAHKSMSALLRDWINDRLDLPELA